MQAHRFTVPVNCYIPDENARTDTVQDFEQYYEDRGFIMLPDQYSEEGKPTRLVIIIWFALMAMGVVVAIPYKRKTA